LADEVLPVLRPRGDLRGERSQLLAPEVATRREVDRLTGA